MPEPADTRGPERVNAADPSAAAYWARRFKVPVEAVAAAVRAVGDDPARVAAHLGVRWPDGFDGIV